MFRSHGLWLCGYNDSASDLRSLRCSWLLRLSCASFSMSLLHCRCISIAPSLSGAAGLELSMLLATDPRTPDDDSIAASVFCAGSLLSVLACGVVDVRA